MNAYKTYEDADGVWLRESGGDLNGPYETVREALEDVARDAALCDGQQVENLPLSAVVEYARLTLEEDE